MLTVIIVWQNLFSSWLPRYCIWILGELGVTGVLLSIPHSKCYNYDFTALQSARTKASAQSESSDKVELCLIGVCSCRVCFPAPSLCWYDSAHHYPEDVCVGGWLHYGNLLYGIRESFYEATRVSFFSVIKTLVKMLKKLDLEKWFQLSKLQWTYSTFQNVLLFLHYFIHVLSFEGPLAASLPSLLDFLIFVLIDLTLLPITWFSQVSLLSWHV